MDTPTIRVIARVRYLAFVGQDLVTSGHMTGQQMAKVMGGKEKVLIYSLDVIQWSHDRKSVARQALTKYPGASVVGLISATNRPPRGVDTQ